MSAGKTLIERLQVTLADLMPPLGEGYLVNAGTVDLFAISARLHDAATAEATAQGVTLGQMLRQLRDEVQAQHTPTQSTGEKA